MEEGETPQYALQRELHEELGVEVSAYPPTRLRRARRAPRRAPPPTHTRPPRRRAQVEVDALQPLTFVSHHYTRLHHNFLALLYGERALGFRVLVGG